MTTTKMHQQTGEPLLLQAVHHAAHIMAANISFQAMQTKLKAIVDIIRADPAVDTVVGFTGGSRAGGGSPPG